MPISASLVDPGSALDALAAAIAEIKGTDPLAPVTVVVPTNTCGVMTRRALGRRDGIAGVDMVTLNRLAELIAGPGLAAAGRSPMSTPVIDLTIAGILADDPGPFAPVATHPSTVVALRQLHTELRLARPEAVAALAARSHRASEAVRVSEAITAARSEHWYDEADLFLGAADDVRAAEAAGLRRLVLYLPQELPGVAVDLVRSLAERIDVHVVAQLTGEPAADGDTLALVESLGGSPGGSPVGSSDGSPTGSTADLAGTGDDTAVSPPGAIVSTTDADDEVRAAVRAVVEAAREGVAFERVAVLWPEHRPYARLVEHHLDAAGIPWNGRPGTSLAERLPVRLVLDLLDVDRRGLRRRAVFDLLADLPLRDAAGEHLPTAGWERVSRYAGIARDDDWDRRLGALSVSPRWGPTADTLRAFVAELRDDLGPVGATRRWAAWAGWCNDQLERRLGRTTIDHLSDADYRAYEALTAALDRLAHLDPIGDPVTRHGFRTTLEAELDAAPLRRGRVGHGVTVGPLAGAVGLDVDRVVVLGAAEGLLPPRPTSDPLLSDADRAIAGLPTSDARASRLHRTLLVTLATSHVTLTVPRGDLRSTSEVEPSRWIAEWFGDRTEVPSHHAGIESTEFPASPAEHRLRRRSVLARAASPTDDRDTSDDPVLERGRRLRDARASDALTEFDGDLSAAAVPRLDGVVSPSRLEAWASCPHAYFDRYLLEVDPVEEPGDEISITARDRGTAHHAALDRFHRAVVDGDLPQPGPTGWTDEHAEALASCFDEVCAGTERRGRTGRPASWADERARMLDDLLGWLRHDSARVVERGATVLASELRFGADDADGDAATITLPDGRPIRLQGSIDRVDRTRDGRLVVTDHKSGDKRKFADLSAADPTSGGTLFQLPSYAAAARARFGTPDTPVIAEYGLLRKGDYARPGYLVDADVDRRVREAVAHLVAGIERGWFPNRPERPGWRMFVACHYCEPDGLGTAERWAEWERKRHDPRLAPWFGDPEEADG